MNRKRILAVLASIMFAGLPLTAHAGSATQKSGLLAARR